MEYIAHIKDDDASDGVNRIEETVTEHSEKVAKLAEKYGQPLRIPHIAYSLYRSNASRCRKVE